ncbi:MAG: helix-turn-helix domain-containing protein, partial [Alphaproteobacteria bacterium]|nr:helix-turn-helix domain-containing protein [Alphaproteobacteria bacterium]
MASLSHSVENVEPRSGATANGMPLSLNRAPAPDLDPWVGRVVVTRVHAAPDHEVHCSVFNDLAFSRVVLAGRWCAETPSGRVRVDRAAVLMGPQSRRMDLSCRGGFATVNIGFRPGALDRLLDRPVSGLVDRVECADPFGLVGEGADAGFPDHASIEDCARIAERRMRAFIERTQPREPDPVSSAFEAASFLDPNTSPGDFAEAQGLSLRQVERIVRRDFGMTPRTVLRRARAMDLACQMLGLSDAGEEQDFLLRYFDQSHLIREFQHFFGVTPQAFRARPRILLTLNLEARAARRLEELDRIAPGARRPWHER